MSEIDKIIVESLVEDLKKAKSTEMRKQIVAEINEIKSKDLTKKCVIIGTILFIAIVIIGNVSKVITSPEAQEVYKEAAWYNE